MTRLEATQRAALGFKPKEELAMQAAEAEKKVNWAETNKPIY